MDDQTAPLSRREVALRSAMSDRRQTTPDDLLLGRAMMAETDAEIAWGKVQEYYRHIIRLRAAGQAAFEAMISFRDSGSQERLQDAIDRLGSALSREEGR